MLAAGLDDLHSVSIYNWKLGVMTACFPGGLFKIMAAEMTPNGLGVIQAGVKHIKFHSIQGRNIISQNGLLGKKGKKSDNALHCLGGEQACYRH